MLAEPQHSRYVHQRIDIHKPSSNAQGCGGQVATKPSTQSQYQPRTLSGAMDVHAASVVVVRMMDGAKPHTSQTFKPADFLAWVQRQ
jgi:hypothetical protein